MRHTRLIEADREVLRAASMCEVSDRERTSDDRRKVHDLRLSFQAMGVSCAETDRKKS